jgi:predicted nucleic acid-binding protein
VETRFVLDAWAILALLQSEEPAASRIKTLLKSAQHEGAEAANSIEIYISIINLGEVIYRIGKVKGEIKAIETLEQIRNLPLIIVSATDEAVFAAAKLKMRYAISYADAFAAATTEALNAILVTGDPELNQLNHKIKIEKLERYKKD